MTDEEVRTLWDSMSGNSERIAKAKEEGLGNAFERNRDEYNDIIDYAPTAGQQTYDLGTDDAGNPILGNTLNDAFMQSEPQKKAQEKRAGWTPFDTADAAEKILADESGGELTMEENTGWSFLPDPVQVASNLQEKALNSKLYAMHVYNMKGDDWLEKCRLIQEKTGVDVTGVSDADTFQKMWQAAHEIEQKEKLATDENGHVDMDKLRDMVPYLGDLEEVRDVAGALMILNAAQGFKSINDVYDNELSRGFGSVITGFARGYNQFRLSMIGAKAIARATASNEGLTPEEAKEILDYQKALGYLPDYSYSGVGSAVGGVLGNVAEQAFIMAPALVEGLIGTAAGVAGTPVTGGASMALSAASYAAMTAQMAGTDYIDLVTATDENGKPRYTPREAAAMAMANGALQAVIEKKSLAAQGRAILGKDTAIKLAEVYAKKDAALKAGQTLEGVTMDIVKERLKSGFGKAALQSGVAELEEEFEQKIAEDVTHNIGEIVTQGKDADVKTIENILSDAVEEGVAAFPAVFGMGVIGGVGNVGWGAYAGRRRFKAAQASRFTREVMENESDSAIIDGVGEHLNEIEEIKDPNLRESALDSINEKHGMKEREVDIKTLVALNQTSLVDKVVEASGTSEEEVQKCMEGTGFLTVKTSVLQQLSHDMTPEERETLNQHRTARGRQTNYQIIEYAKYLNEALTSVDMKQVEEDTAAVEGFVNSTFEDENERSLAYDIVAANMENPALEVRNRQRENKAALDAIFEPALKSLRSGMGQGVEIVQQEDRDGRDVRVSNNAEWYKNFFADHGRLPTEEELQEIAYENLIGTATRYADSQITLNDGSPEAQEYFAAVKAEIDGLREESARLSKMLDVFGNFKSGEFMPHASMPEGAREAYQAIYDALKASGVKKVSNNARANAILAARIAERIAQEKREAGDKEATALSVLPKILPGIVGDKSALSQFAGENAETADKVKLAEAQKMESEGKAADEIYKATGWFKGLDGKWRFEIKDNLDTIDLDVAQMAKSVPLGRIYYNPDLYDAYPFLRMIQVKAVKNLSKNTWGETTYDKDGNVIIRLNKNLFGEDERESKLTLVHEIAHIIQGVEDFATGGTAKYARESLAEAGRSQEVEGVSDDEVYNRLGGEQEAREVERRASVEKDLADKSNEAEEAKTEGDNKKYFMARLAKEGLIRKSEAMPRPHSDNAIILFDGQEIPYSQKQDESPAGENEAAEKENSENQYPEFNGFIGAKEIVAYADAMMRRTLASSVFFEGFSSDSNMDDFREKLLSPLKVAANGFLNRYGNANNSAQKRLYFNLAAEMIWYIDEGRRQFDNGQREGIFGALTGTRRYRELDREGSHLRQDRRARNEANARGITSFGVLKEHDDFIKGFEKEVEYIRNNDPLGRSNQGGFSNALNQDANAKGKRVTRGQYNRELNIVSLFQDADQSTFMHEMSHFYLNELEQIAAINPNGQAAKDFATVSKWAEWHKGDADAFKGTSSAKEFADLEKEILAAEKAGNTEKANDLKWTWKQEKFARGFEEYLRSGNAPTNTLQKIFRSFKTWLTRIYNDFIGVGVKPSAEVEAVMARMVASDEEINMHYVLKESNSVIKTNPDLMNSDTTAMVERWVKEAKEEAKETLLKELIKEQEEKDVDAHMEAFEAEERERLAHDPAFGVLEMARNTDLTEEEACEIAGYNSVEAWRQDLEQKGGSFEAALSASMEAERERYTKEMPNQERISEMAEEAIASSDYAQRLTALEAEILRRRERKYDNAPKRLADAFRAAEDALDMKESDDPIKTALLKLKYAYRWGEKQAKEIEKMQATIEALKAAAQEDKAKLRKKLEDQIQRMKDATIQNKEWLRGVRDAAKGSVKMARDEARNRLLAMSVKDATNTRRWINEARKASQESLKYLAKANSAKDKRVSDSGALTGEGATQNNLQADQAPTKGQQYARMAYLAKMRQTYYEQMAAESLKLRRELQKVQNDMKRVQKGLVNAKGKIDASTRYYIGHIQYMLGFRGKDAPMPQNLTGFNALFNSLKDRYDDSGVASNVGDIDSDVDVPQWLLELAISQKRMPTKYTDYTIEELQDMRKVVDMLYKTGQNKNALLSENFDGKDVGEVTEELRDDFTKTVTVESGDEGISEFFAKMLKPVVMLKALGNKWKKYFYDPLFDAFENQERMTMSAAEELNKLFGKYWSKSERRKIRNKELNVTLPDGTKLTKEQVLAMALNWGNEGNRLRLLNSISTDGADIENIFKQVLTEKDWAFVQEAWDYINTFGDKVNDVVEKLTGVPMTRVEPSEFTITTSDGKTLNLRGGYYPIAYDPKKSTVTAEQELTTSQKAFGGAVFSTGMGSTKNRAQAGPEDAKLLLSMDVLFRHVNQQIHIATMRLACRDVYKLLQNKEIRHMVEGSIGMNAYRELKRWVENVWQEPLDDRDPAKQLLEAGRKNTVAAIMAYRTSVSVLNTLPNYVLMTRELGPVNALKACLECWSTKGSRAWILEESPFMRNRANNIDRDIKRAQKNSFTPDNPFQDMVARTSGWLMEQTDMIFSLPTYYWTYNQTLNNALEKGMTQKEAAKEAHRAAEDTVRKIFGSADAVDQSHYQRSKDLIIKAITPFYTYVSTQANAVFEEYLKARYQGSNAKVLDDGEIKKIKKSFMERWGAMVHAVLFTYVLETFVEQLMRDAIAYATGDDGDDELLDAKEFGKRWASQSLTTFTASIPVANILGEYVGNKIMGKNYSLRGFGVVSAAQERVKKAADDVDKLIKGKGDAIEVGRDVAKAASAFTAFPDVFTDAVFNAARAYKDGYGLDEWFIKSLFDKKLKPKDKRR